MSVDTGTQPLPSGEDGSSEQVLAGQRRGRPLLVGLLVVTVVVVAGWAVTRRDSPTQFLTAATGEAVIQQFPESDQATMEPFTAVLLDGAPFDSAGVEERVKVYNVWGSWCAPCRKEAPAPRTVATETAGKVAFIGINVRDSRDPALAFERSYDNPLPEHPDRGQFRGAAVLRRIARGHSGAYDARSDQALR